MSPSRKKRREQRATYGLEYGNDRKVKILPTTKPGFLRSAYEVLTGESESDTPYDAEDTEEEPIGVPKHKIVYSNVPNVLARMLDEAAKDGWVLHSMCPYGNSMAAVMVLIENE